MELEDNIKQFSSALKNARIQAGLTQQELANKMNVSRDLVNRMEKGDNVGIHNIIAAVTAIDATLGIFTSHTAKDDDVFFGLDEGSVMLISESEYKQMD